MGQIDRPAAVLSLVAVCSRYVQALDWSERILSEAWGPIALKSADFDFTQTTYYRATMGDELKKRFLCFERLVPPSALPRRKHQTNAWEEAYSKLADWPQSRPLNLDPGYLSLGKLVLASTKDHSHRVYLSRGIYGEVTLYFRQGAWTEREWTYPDYRSPEYHAFFHQGREYLKQRLARGHAS